MCLEIEKTMYHLVRLSVLRMCVCVYIYIYTHTDMHMHTNIYVCTHTHTHAGARIAWFGESQACASSIWTSGQITSERREASEFVWEDCVLELLVHGWAVSSAGVYVCMYACMCRCVCVYVCGMYVCVCIKYTNTHMRIRVGGQLLVHGWAVSSAGVYVCMYVCMYVACMCVYI